MKSELQLYLFGGLEVRLNGTPVTGFLSSKVPAMLAYLAVTGRSHQRDTLATLFWGELSDSDARNNLRQALSNLRKYVDAHLIISRDSVALNPDAALFVDAVQFETHLRAARDQTPEVRAARMQAAVGLYLSDFMAGFTVRDAPAFEEWMLAQRTRLHELALHALHAVTEHHLSHGQYGRAIDSASRLLALDAWREEAHRQLMLALARSGQRSAALAQYQTCRRVLERELGVTPSAETTALFQRIHAAGDTPPHNLPAQPTAFIGRHEEVALIESRLLQPACRLITLVGPGGTGKTRLALEAARRARDLGIFLNGVYFVALAPLPTPDLVVPAIADAVGLTLGGQQEPQHQLARFLKEKEMLLVLDNMEHLLDVAGWLGQLLQRAPAVKLLVTTRERLNLQWEWAIPVTGLDSPPTDSDISPQQFGAVQLFVDRARAVAPHLALDRETLACIGRICRLVAGLPLGIELAAAGLHHFSCAEIADGISRSADFLATHHRDTPPRHRSLRAAFDHSWRLLAPVEQAAFARLSTFSGGFDQPAALALGVSPHLLSSLLDKSLIQRAAGGRYGLHELLRQFGAELLGAPAATDLAVAHSDYYLDWLAQREQQLRGREQKEALTAVAADYDNVRAAWQTALDRQRWAALAPAVEPLYYFYLLRSRLLEGLASFDAGRQTVAAAADASQRLSVHLTNVTAKMLISLSRTAEARPLLEANLAAEAAAALPDLEAATRRYYGSVLVSLGELEEAEGHFERSRALARALGDGWAEANTLMEWARLAFVRKRLDACRERCEAGLALAEQSGELLLIANFLTGLSIAHREAGNLDAAGHYIQRSLAVYADLDDTYGLVQGHLTLGALFVHQGRFDEARALFLRALTGSRTIGFRWGEADALWRLGQADAGLGDPNGALGHWREALELALAIREVELVRDLLFDTAMLFGRSEQPRLVVEILNWLLHLPTLPESQRAAVEVRLAEVTAGGGDSGRDSAESPFDPSTVAAVVDTVRAALAVSG